MNMKNLIASGLATLAAMFRRKETFLSNKQKKAKWTFYWSSISC